MNLEQFQAAHIAALIEANNHGTSTPERCTAFANRVAVYLKTGTRGFIHDDPSIIKAWRVIGGKGKPTWKALFALAGVKEGPKPKWA